MTTVRPPCRLGLMGMAGCKWREYLWLNESHWNHMDSSSVWTVRLLYRKWQWLMPLGLSPFYILFPLGYVLRYNVYNIGKISTGTHVHVWPKMKWNVETTYPYEYLSFFLFDIFLKLYQNNFRILIKIWLCFIIVLNFFSLQRIWEINPEDAGLKWDSFEGWFNLNSINVRKRSLTKSDLVNLPQRMQTLPGRDRTRESIQVTLGFLPKGSNKWALLNI